MLAYVVHRLPLLGNALRSPVLAGHAAQVVVHADFVVEVIEARSDISAIALGVIYLRNEEHVGVLLLDLCNRPCPECLRHHLRHIATEAINAFACPEEQYMQHLMPSVGNRVELLFAAVLVEDTIVEFNGLVPVIFGRVGGKAVVARSAGGVLLIALHIEVRSERLAHIVEVIERRECPFGVIIGT